MNRKAIILVFLLFASVVAYIVYIKYNKQHDDLRRIEADVVLTAKALFKDYESEALGDAKYLGKVVELSGGILEMEDQPEKRQVILDTGDLMTRVSCMMDARIVPSGLEAYKLGDTIRLRCRCVGKLMDVALDRCIIVN